MKKSGHRWREGAAPSAENAAVQTAAEAIKDAAAQSGSGPFTIYAFSGGAQVTQSALALLGPAIAARAAQPGDGQMGVNRYPTLYQGKPELLAL